MDCNRLRRTLTVSTVNVPVKKLHELRKNEELSRLLLRLRNQKNVLSAESSDRKLLLLAQKYEQEELLAALPAATLKVLEDNHCTFGTYDLEISYEHLSAAEALAALLPSEVEVPVSFETVGHIAHFNLTDTQRPYGSIIGQVIIDKNPTIRTVVTKSHALDNQFRNLPLELLCGDPDYVAHVKEQFFDFVVDYANVYWNSRLSSERQRICEAVPTEAYVIDATAGVGGFSLYLARKGCNVFANDLNPRAYELITINAKNNDVEHKIKVSNVDAREHVQTTIQKIASDSSDPATMQISNNPINIHVIFNLPELSLEFLGVLRGVLRDSSMTNCGSDVDMKRKDDSFAASPPISVTVHAYCFSRWEDSIAEVQCRVIESLGYWDDLATARFVRKVSPNKNMILVTLRVPYTVLSNTAAVVGCIRQTEQTTCVSRKRQLGNMNDDTNLINESANRSLSKSQKAAAQCSNGYLQ